LSSGTSAVHRTDHVVVGNLHAVEENLVEHGVAGELAQRTHDYTRAVHVDDEVGDPVVAFGFGIGARQADPEVRLVRERGPDLLPAQLPTGRTADCPGRQACKVGPGTGLAEELAPGDLSEQGRTDEAALLVLGPVGDEGGEHPRADRQVRPLDTCPGELLVDHELLHRRCIAAPRARPVRAHQPLRDHPGTAHGLVEAGQAGDDRLDLGPSALGFAQVRGRQLGGQAPPGTGNGEACHLDAHLGGPSEHLAQAQRAPQVQVGVVLPGEAHAAEHLDASLGVIHGGIKSEGRADCGAQMGASAPGVAGRALGARELGVQCLEGIPGDGRSLLGRPEHAGKAVLHGLELADRPSKLLPLLGVGDRGVETPPGDARALCRS
jgi:hypothetical protein